MIAAAGWALWGAGMARAAAVSGEFFPGPSQKSDLADYTVRFDPGPARPTTSP